MQNELKQVVRSTCKEAYIKFTLLEDEFIQRFANAMATQVRSLFGLLSGYYNASGRPWGGGYDSNNVATANEKI